MKLEQIIKEAGNILGLDLTKATKKILFRCANMTLAGIACNYVDCITEEVFNVTDERIDFNAFKENVYKIKECSSSYQLYLNYVAVPNGWVNIKYAYIPKFKRLSDKLTTVCPLVSDTLLLNGILAEYAEICGLVDEAKLWGDRYERSLAALTHRARRIPS